jgi:hypothetical protein
MWPEDVATGVFGKMQSATALLIVLSLPALFQ